MFRKNIAVGFIILLIMIMRYTEITPFLPGIIKGKVIDARSGKPMEKVHVIIVSGEEEDFTNSSGEFSLKTTLQFPIDIVIEYKGYQRQSARCLSEKERLLIALRPEEQN